MIAKFNIDLEHFNEETEETTKEVVEVTMQETSPFVVGDIFTSNATGNGGYRLGSLIKDMAGVVIVSPKNILKKIEGCDNAFSVMGEIFKEVNQFCNNPKKYVLLQRKSQEESKNMEHGDTESNANGNQAV